MKVALFCKTCQKDAEWFKYMIRSIARFASGFSELVVVTDPGAGYLSAIPHGIDVRLCAEPLPSALGTGFDSQRRLEYYWASAMKTCWTDFTDADAVVWIDSDSMFTRPVTPDFWFQDGRPIWYRVPWSESVDGCKAWKRGVDHLFEVDSQNENMAVCAGLATRTATLALHSHIKRRYGQSVREYYLHTPPPLGIGEYTMVGGHLEHCDPCNYIIRHPRELQEPWPVKQFWSWGPMPRDEMEAILVP